MCVDYTDLNEHCPKDPFGLPQIDEVVDSTADCELLSFLDCYSGYHQISLKEDNQIKTLFITPFRCILLYHHVFWTQEHQGDLPKGHLDVP